MEILLRPSGPEGVPVQRTLWSLSFGDERAYINNFYKNYFRPVRGLGLHREGAVRAMTAWFSTVLSIPGKDQIFRAAYLYAVCVHPDWRGKGLAGKLLDPGMATENGTVLQIWADVNGDNQFWTINEVTRKPKTSVKATTVKAKAAAEKAATEVVKAAEPVVEKAVKAAKPVVEKTVEAAKPVVEKSVHLQWYGSPSLYIYRRGPSTP